MILCEWGQTKDLLDCAFPAGVSREPSWLPVLQREGCSKATINSDTAVGARRDPAAPCSSLTPLLLAWGWEKPIPVMAFGCSFVQPFPLSRWDLLSWAPAGPSGPQSDAVSVHPRALSWTLQVGMKHVGVYAAPWSQALSLALSGAVEWFRVELLSEKQRFLTGGAGGEGCLLTAPLLFQLFAPSRSFPGLNSSSDSVAAVPNTPLLISYQVRVTSASLGLDTGLLVW